MRNDAREATLCALDVAAEAVREQIALLRQPKVDSSHLDAVSLEAQETRNLLSELRQAGQVPVAHGIAELATDALIATIQLRRAGAISPAERARRLRIADAWCKEITQARVDFAEPGAAN